MNDLKRINIKLKERSRGMTSHSRDPKNYTDKSFFGKLVKGLVDLEEGTSVHFYIEDSGNDYKINLIAFVSGRGMINQSIPFKKGPEFIGRVIINKKFTLNELKEKFHEAHQINDESVPW